jgi:YHS domain-containing protein
MNGVADARVQVKQTTNPPMKKLLTVLAFSVASVLSAAPVNTVCPVCSRPIRSDLTSTYKGETVAFHESKCKTKFDAEPAKYAGKIKKG